VTERPERYHTTNETSALAMLALTLENNLDLNQTNDETEVSE
jgi:hypothetical protein